MVTIYPLESTLKFAKRPIKTLVRTKQWNRREGARRQVPLNQHWMTIKGFFCLFFFFLSFVKPRHYILYFWGMGPLEILGHQNTIQECKHQTRISARGCQQFYYGRFILMIASKTSKVNKIKPLGVRNRVGDISCYSIPSIIWWHHYPPRTAHLFSFT